MDARQVLKLIYKGGMIAIAVALATLAFILYRTATPGNGQLLVSGIVFLLALFAFLSIGKLDWQDEQAATYRGILDDLRARLPLSIRFADAGAAHGVHHVDGALLNEARRMEAEGAPIDLICRMIDPEHDRHDPLHQEAFRRILRAALQAG